MLEDLTARRRLMIIHHFHYTVRCHYARTRSFTRLNGIKRMGSYTWTFFVGLFLLGALVGSLEST